MFKAFKFELRPHGKQVEMLNKHFGCARFVYNWGLNEKSKAYKESSKNITCFDLTNRLVGMKKEQDFLWLAEVHSQTLQMSLRNLDNAFTAFFKKRARFPKFKKKSRNQSFQYSQGVKLNNDKVYLPKIGWVCFFKSREAFGVIKTVTVSCTANGRFFVSILCDTGLKIHEKVEIKTAVGVDLGLKVFAYTSGGEVFENQKHLAKNLKKLRVAQRSLARKKNGSNRRDKQRLRVAKIHEKVAFQRNDFLHKVSTDLVLRYDAICIEDLNVAGMVKNRKLARAISDVGWASFRSMLEYKCEWYGKTLKVIGRFEPSSKMCNHCGHINKDLKLSDRIWTCQNCQRTVERDFNAALNIKDFGLGHRPSVANVKHLACA